jgi:hypothetical protein
MTPGYIRPLSGDLRDRDCRAVERRWFYARVMALRIHRVSAARWARLAASRYEDATNGATIDLVALEAEENPGRRMRTEHARIQACVNALAPQGAR